MRSAFMPTNGENSRHTMRLSELIENLDIPREQMPQLGDVDLEKDHDTQIETAKLADLNTSQEDRVEGKVDAIKRKIQAGEHPDPIVVDTNNYVVDGHHRYEAYKDLGYQEVAILRVLAELPDLIDQYDHTTDDTPVTESLNQPYPYTITKDRDNFMATATTDSGAKLEIAFDALIMHHVDQIDGYSVEFAVDEQQGITGSGDPYRIFATVSKAVQQVVTNLKPGILKFSAQKPTSSNAQVTTSREKLYDRMAGMLAKKHGYELNTTRFNWGTEYTLTSPDYQN